MKRKNLIILLLLPFIIAILSVTVIKATVNFVDNDITSIVWNYEDYEAFSINVGEYELKASTLYNTKYALSEGNALTWAVTSTNGGDTDLAEIKKVGNAYYLVIKGTGEVTITCSNEKNTVTRSMNAKLYKNAAITLNDTIKGSGNNIDSTIYYGEYDIKNNKLTKSSIKYKLGVAPSDIKNSVIIKDSSNNINVSIKDNYTYVEFLGVGEASFKIGVKESDEADLTTKFNIVDKGVNVYSYDDLLYCTNKSNDGEIVVMRTSLESYENTYNSNGDLVDERVKLFGNYDGKNFNFKNEIYTFETTYNHDYIDEWNEFCSSDNKYSKISLNINVGIHVQKDFYGNGYSINLHDLCYPYEEVIINTDNGNQISPLLSKNNLFRGPLPFYTLGDHNNTYLIEIYGQDNIGMYVDGDNILINDIDIRNSDFGNTLSNLKYTGTVLEVNGDNNTIKNSKLSNGKHVLRSFSSLNLTIDNSMLKNAYNFLFYTGSNECIKFDDTFTSTILDLNGSSITKDNATLNKKDGEVDKILEEFINGSGDKEALKKSLKTIQDMFNNDTKNNYVGSTTINSVIFYQSGISSIGIDTYFNGAYLYSNIPSYVTNMLEGLSMEGKRLLPFIPSKLNFTSYPVNVNITGNTLFYDYKDESTLDLSGLIGENITTIANNNLSLISDSKVRNITIDDIFPIKKLLYNASSLSNNKLCTIISYYGGGLNNSKVTFENTSNISNDISIDLVDSYLNMSVGSGTMAQMKNMMIKVVTTVTGFEPFKFVTYTNDYLYNKLPDVSDLKRSEK